MSSLSRSMLSRVRDAPGRAELTAIWDALERDGRRLLLAHARAVAEMTGRPPREQPGPSAPSSSHDPQIERDEEG